MKSFYPFSILTILLVAVFVVFLVLSKCYTLRERNREINIQAIVEEHYERYMDQEEEYMREQPGLHIMFNNNHFLVFSSPLVICLSFAKISIMNWTE